MAASCGDAQPTAAAYVVTTRQAAMWTIGAGVDSDPPVYFVVVRGRFVDTHAKMSAADKPFPRGTIIDFTVDIATHDIRDFGISDHTPDLCRLGPVHELPL